MAQQLTEVADRMFVNWKGVLVVLAVLTAIIGLCVVDLRCGGPTQNATMERIRGEIDAGKKERRIMKADELAELARNMRELAQYYLQKGEKQKAQRAIGAAQELDKKILELRGERQ